MTTFTRGVELQAASSTLAAVTSTQTQRGAPMAAL
jgi:hypothetical protein